jgi:formylglycine-generating enzyme required for sulfatase activity
MPVRTLLWVSSFLGLATLAVAQRPVPADADLLKTSIGMTLKRIPAGTFAMGSSPEEDSILLNQKPQHTVKISRPFYLGIYEVTQREYTQIMNVNPSKFRGSDSLPVEQVSWFDAVIFCNKLSEREGRKPYYRIDGQKVSLLKGNGFRLPTEAEWEYSCRAGTKTPFPFESKDTDIEKYGWFKKNSGGKTHPVGRKKPNGFGLYDMMGNVFEWCGDWFAVDYYEKSPGTDPTGPAETELRTIRGTAWMVDAVLVRSAYRNRSRPMDRDNMTGFRVAASVD